ncbi:hypothetical protein SCMC78_08610 [Streptomyces sp. CMC78]|uniref:Uncharacterized protein n=1 Tax=Streptomyces sp. CMC78 TaxID=3231512 RepID=A0AB33KC70_9ACTN
MHPGLLRHSSLRVRAPAARPATEPGAATRLRADGGSGFLMTASPDDGLSGPLYGGSGRPARSLRAPGAGTVTAWAVPPVGGSTWPGSQRACWFSPAAPGIR